MILISRLEAIANGTTPDAMLIPAIELIGIRKSAYNIENTAHRESDGRQW